MAYMLADLYQKDGDLPSARRAAMRGLQADPVSEILYLDLLRTEYRAGNLSAVRETADKLATLPASLDVETTALGEFAAVPGGLGSCCAIWLSVTSSNN
ncbi:hypothetical protein [Amycolatopsis sp. NPDC004378]